MRIVVTGASGFIGERIIETNSGEFEIIPLSLRNKSISSINLTGADAIIHLAGKAHDLGRVDDKVYFDINYTLTKDLAELAVKQSVPHFLYVSTVKVYGEETGLVWNEHSACNANDAYGKSKLQAEIFLQGIQSENFRVAIVRPPLVYGAGVKGNMLRLMHLVQKNTALPFAKTNNLRSMVYVDNLIDLFYAIIRKKASGIFLASDEKPLSTEELLLLIKNAFGSNNKFISLPKPLRSILKIAKPSLYKRLFGSLVINTTETNQLLNFLPRYSTAFGIEQMVNWFKTIQ